MSPALSIPIGSIQKNRYHQGKSAIIKSAKGVQLMMDGRTDLNKNIEFENTGTDIYQIADKLYKN